MTKLTYHASHEQFKPSELLGFIRLAEESGFHGIFSSDHFHPWSEHQGNSGFSWLWLGAAMQSSRLPFGMICAPGYRYHPAVTAQAIATAAEMFGSRFWISLGSGEALNERITGEAWPAKEERNKRLLECVSLIRRLLKGETVTHYGYTKTEEAKLYTLPQTAPEIYGAALTEETAKWIGQWSDGMLTLSAPLEKLGKIIKAYRSTAGKQKPIKIKVQVSYDISDEKALEGAYDQWRTNIFPGELSKDLTSTKLFDEAASYVRAEDLHEHVCISSKPEKHISYIRQFIGLGFSEIIVHNVNRSQKAFIRHYSESVLPSLSKQGS